jgi:hypothetical protein
MWKVSFSSYTEGYSGTKCEHSNKLKKIKLSNNPEVIFNPDPDPEPIQKFSSNPDPDRSQNVNLAGLYYKLHRPLPNAINALELYPLNRHSHFRPHFSPLAPGPPSHPPPPLEPRCRLMEVRCLQRERGGKGLE